MERTVASVGARASPPIAVMISAPAPELAAAAHALRTAQRVVVFTGSGVSVESGIATFRGRGGLWERHALGRYDTVPALLRTAVTQPAELSQFLCEVLEPMGRARPNAAHRAVAQLERARHVTVVTQNVDGLHQDAGSHGVRQLHGSMLEVADSRGRVIRRLSRGDLLRVSEGLKRAQGRSLTLLRVLRALRPLLGVGQRGPYRPHVVLFGEPLCQPDWDDARRGAEQCDAMLIVGTSGMVLPAAELPMRARMRGATTILVDPGAGVPADIHLRGAAGAIMPALVGRALR